MTKSNVELRTIDYNDFDFDDDSLKVTGYVNETGRMSELLNDDGQEFVEIMQPGVFTNALASADFVDFYYEHDPEKVLATTQNSSLTLNEDEIGLKMSATIVNTSWGSDAYQMIKSGVIKGMSFGMIVTEDDWDTSGLLPVRTISQIELFEVSAVRFPAYPDSSIESRNIKSRVEARGMNLVRNTKIPEGKKEVRELDNESNNADLINALNANTQAQNSVADALHSIAYTLNTAFNSSEDRSKKNDKPEESEERAGCKKRDNEEAEEKAKETKSEDDKVETESNKDSKKKSESDKSETKSEDKPDPQGDNKEQTELMSKDKEKKSDEERSKEDNAAMEAFRSFFKNRENI